jgi:methylated-DNA-[protein]-cysteine S-methyltransferase
MKPVDEHLQVHQSPIGPLVLVATDGALVGLYLAPGGHRDPACRGTSPVLERVRAQLDEYFAGTRRMLDVPVDPPGTGFQRDVWAALGRIPFGETRTYAEVAREVGRPRAVRAVGSANGQNPISIIVPCHRVVGSDGTLTGYAGGLERKRWLLAHERREGASPGLQPSWGSRRAAPPPPR